MALLIVSFVSLLPPAPANASDKYTKLVAAPQPNGRVWAITVVSGIAYLGGDFTAVTKRSGQTVSRRYLAAVDLSTRELTSWNPGADDSVFALATDGKRVFAGGAFKTIGGKSASRLAAINTKGTLAPGWEGRAGYIVRDLVTYGSRLYVGGQFAKLNGAIRPNVGAVRTDDGSLLPFKTVVGGPSGNMVRSLAIDPAGTRLYLGGYFETLNGVPNYHMGAVDAQTGATKPWAWHPTGTAYPDDMQANSTGLFVGFAAKGTDFHGQGSFNLQTGAARWTLRTCGDVQDLELEGGVMYIAGHLRCIQSLTVAPRTGLGAMSYDGAIQPWKPTANIGCSNGCLGPWELQRCGIYLCVGGDFSRINGTPQEKFTLLK